MQIAQSLAIVEQRISAIAEMASRCSIESAVDPSPSGEVPEFSSLVGSLDASSDDNITSSLPMPDIDRMISQSSTQWDVDPNLVKAIVANESNFNARATSTTGAQGLMQLMTETAAALGVTDPYDASQNIGGGTRYLRGLLDRFHGNVRLAVAAYNAGPNAVLRYGDVPPYAETRAYVANVLASYSKYQHSP